MREVYKYTPAQYEPNVLAKHSVGINDILKRILKTLKTGANRASNPHFLLIGSRGMGKTHILFLIYHIIKGNIKKEDLPVVEGFGNLKKHWIPVLFLEENYSINTIEDLFFGICKRLQYEIPSKKLDRFLKIAEDEILFDEEFVDSVVSLLNDVRKKKKYLLLIDNLHEILGCLNEKEQERWRAILHNNHFFMIIGSATSYFEMVSEYKKPFYNFFQPIHLREMDYGEVKKLIEGWLKANEREDIIKRMDELEGKIKAIIHLTGGNPRLILSIYQIISDFGIISVENQLLSLLEELTPYLRDVVTELSPQQKKIMEVMAQKGIPLSPTEIGKITKLKVQTITSQLKRLESAGHIKILKEKGKRETLYDIKDKLYSLWRQMRSESGKRKLRFLSQFLEIWYTPKELIKRADGLIQKAHSYLETGQREMAIRSAEELYYIAEALPTNRRKILLHLEQIDTYIRGGDFSMAEEEIEKIEKKTKKNKKKEELVFILNTKGRIYYAKGEYKKALKVVDEILTHTPNYAVAWHNKGVSLEKLGRHKEALKSFDRAIELKPDYARALTVRVFSILFLSIEDIKKENYKRAMEYLKKAVRYEKEAEKKVEKKVFIFYLTFLLDNKENEFLIRVLKHIRESGSESLKKSVYPYLRAIEYIEKKDRMILLRTPQTVRDIVEDIAKKLK